MMAKVSWKVRKMDSGAVPLSESTVSPERKALPKPPTHLFMEPPSLNARLY